jgi:chorismate mutase-like protein
MNHPADAQPPDGPENSIGSGSLDRLAELVIERLALSLDVAAAKYFNGRPIDDPVREHQILESMTRELNGFGLPRQIARQFLSDQLEANKIVQHQLQQRWREHPEEVPAVRRSLSAEIRPDLDNITAQMIGEFKHMEEVPQVRYGYIEDLVDAKLLTKMPSPDLQKANRDAAVFALRSFVAELHILRCRRAGAMRRAGPAGWFRAGWT